MFKSLLLATFLIFGQKPQASKEPQFGIIAGIVVPQQGTTIKQPLQVLLLSKEYADLWTANVQEREDTYWERYKPALAQKKELFFELSKQAYLDALQFVEDKMHLDFGSNYAKFSKSTSPDGKFDFKNVPLGDYKVLAVGRIGAQQYVWADSINVTGSTPQFVQLKKLP